MPISIPNTFSAGTTAVASQVNTNFTTLGNAAVNVAGDTLTGALSTQALTPSSDNAYGVGTASLRYNNGFFLALKADGVLTTTSLQPSVHNSYDIGLTGTRYKDGWFQGSVTAATALTSGGGITAPSGLFEQGRSTASGVWIPVTYTAGDFTGNGAMTWTVEAGDLLTFAYMLVGKTVTVAVFIVTTTVGGTPNTTLQVKIPGSLVATKDMMVAGPVVDNSTYGMGRISVAPSGTNIVIQKSDVTNWAAATNTTAVAFVFSFQIN